MSDTIELICQLFVWNKRKLKSVSYYVLTALKYGNSELSVFRSIGSMKRPVGCLDKVAYQWRTVMKVIM